MKKLTGMLLCAISLCLVYTATSHATVFYLDSFTVFRNGSTFMLDEFSDGLAPPSGPLGNDTYGTIGVPGPEAGGKLAMDTATGVPTFSNVTGAPLLVHRSRLTTNTSDDPQTGLKLGHEIGVLGIYDLIAPDLERERYSVRLTDFNTGYEANDNVDIGVRRNETGEVVVGFREADFDLNQFMTLGEYVLTEEDFMGFDQIALGLFSPEDSSDVYAAFTLLNSGSHDPGNIFASLDFDYFDAHGNIFDGEDWTRADFIASRVRSVPEPTSLFLLALGLAGLSLTVRRHTRTI